MSIEQVAVLGIALFGFMTIVYLFNTLRAYGRYRKLKPMRVRRLIGGKESARAMAESLIRTAMSEHPEAVSMSRASGRLTPELEARLNAARAHYLSRVEPVHKTLFNESVNRLVFKPDEQAER